MSEQMRFNANKKAEEIIRSLYLPLYPIDKPIYEMTHYEQGMFRQLLIPLSDALSQAWEEGYNKRVCEEGLGEAFKAKECRQKETIKKGR